MNIMKRGYQTPASLKIIVSSLLIMSLWVSAAIPDAMAPRINMNSVMKKKEAGTIQARILDETKISNVMLYYRKPGESHYNSVQMKLKNDDIYYRELKKELGIEGSVEYYLVAQDTSGNETTLPAMSPDENPIKTSMDGSFSVSADEIVLTTPEPGIEYDTGDQLIMITFFKTGREIDFGTIRLRIDNVDRTREADFVGNILMWEPRRPFIDGEHEIVVIANDTAGDPVGPNVWTFRVKTRMALPLGAEGDFYMGIQRDDRSVETSNVPLWNNKIDMDMRGETDWFSWNTGIMLSSEESSFLTTETLPDRQPINRYYIEGRTRHFKVRFGDSNPNFSDLSLKGILVRGMNLEFKSNRFNTNFVWGYNKREIGDRIHIIGEDYYQIDTNTYFNADGDTVSTASDFIVAIQDPTTLMYNIYEYEQGSPKRDVVGLKMDVAPVRNKFATWNFGFNFFGAEDDSSSLKYEYDPDNQTRRYAYRDSSFFTDYKPKKNWVGTIQTSLRLFDNKTELFAEFGGTIATENMFSYLSPEIEKELEDIPEEISNEFPINGSTQTSFDKLKLKDDIGKGLTDAIKSVYKFRLTTPIPIPMTKTRLKAETYRVPTHYVSLGNPQQKTDIGGYKIDLKSRVWRDQLTLSLGYRAYSDNLDSERKQYSTSAFDMKDLTKDTSISNVSVNFAPRQFLEQYSPSLSVGYRAYNAQNNLDLSINTQQEAFNDTTSMIDTSTNTLLFNVGGVLPLGMQKHSGMLSISNMSILDNRPLAEYDLAESDNLTVMFNLNSQLDPLPLGLSASVGHTGNKTYRKDGSLDAGYDRTEVTTSIVLFNFAGTYRWFRDKRLKTTAGFGYIGSSNGEEGIYNIDNSKTSLKVEADYRLTSVSSVGAMFRFINYTDNADSIRDYTEPIIGLNIRSAF